MSPCGSLRFFETLAKQWICWKWNCQKALSMKLLFTRTIPRTGMPVKNSKCFLIDASTIALTWYDTHVESWTANLPTSQPATCQSGSGRTVVMSVLRCCPISDVKISWSLQTAGRSRQKTLRSFASWQVWILWNSALRLVVDASHRFTCTRFLSKKQAARICLHKTVGLARPWWFLLEGLFWRLVGLIHGWEEAAW